MSRAGRKSKVEWLPNVKYDPSENCDDRPSACEIELVVLHAISLPPGQFGGRYIERFFTNSLDCDAHSYFDTLRGVKVCPHFFITRAGLVTQFVGLSKRAWHAGKSKWRGKDNCNDYSIGIELEGCDSLPFEPAQYDSLVRVLVEILALYPTIQNDAIVGHSDVAPGRKTDPGPLFDWGLLSRRMLESRS